MRKKKNLKPKGNAEPQNHDPHSKKKSLPALLSAAVNDLELRARRQSLDDGKATTWLDDPWRKMADCLGREAWECKNEPGS